VEAVDRVVERLAAFLLSVKRRPTIRHQRSSEVSRRVAEDVWRLAYEQEPGLFDFRRSDGGVGRQHSYSHSHSHSRHILSHLTVTRVCVISLTHNQVMGLIVKPIARIPHLTSVGRLFTRAVFSHTFLLNLRLDGGKYVLFIGCER
jgi:hypothetical protein